MQGVVEEGKVKEEVVEKFRRRRGIQRIAIARVCLEEGYASSRR